MLLSIGCGHNIQTNKLSYTPPEVKFQPRLFYPREAQDNSYYGTSKILVLISKTGFADKIYVIKSSGYKLLDSSAMQYCKSMLFSPASKDGELIPSRMEFTVKFDLSNLAWNSADYIEDIKKLSENLKDAAPNDRERFENEILSWHNEFVENMRDLKNFNSTIEQVISPELVSEWKNDWNTFPLSFLVYHDFLQKYQDYKNKADVKKMLQNAVNFDLYFIKNSVPESEKEQQKKANLLIKIKGFMNNQYPDIILESSVISKVSS